MPKASRRTAKAKASPRKQISRRTLDMTLRDVVDRLGKIDREVQAFVTAMRPNDNHLLLEQEVRTAYGVLLGRLQNRISDVHGLVNLLVSREGWL